MPPKTIKKLCPHLTRSPRKGWACCPARLSERQTPSPNTHTRRYIVQPIDARAGHLLHLARRVYADKLPRRGIENPHGIVPVGEVRGFARDFPLKQLFEIRLSGRQLTQRGHQFWVLRLIDKAAVTSEPAFAYLF